MRSILNDPDWVLLGKAGVDSGQLLVCDPCYIDSIWKKEDFDQKEGGEPKDKFSYNAVCKRTLKPDGGGQVNVGVAFGSGYGDGVYPVYGRKDREGRIVEVRIFMVDEDEDKNECLDEEE